MSVLKERAIINSRRCVILAMTLFSAGSLALEDSAATTQSSEAMEEVVVLGRFLNAAQQLLNERRESDSVVDVLDGESISRLGDSTVANAMRRMTGVSLVSDKFVYVRGLGERYSSTTLNGAYIPSPDLTRNVIPLDIFPSAVVSGLSVQKTFSRISVRTLQADPSMCARPHFQIRALTSALSWVRGSTQRLAATL